MSPVDPTVMDIQTSVMVGLGSAGTAVASRPVTFVTSAKRATRATLRLETACPVGLTLGSFAVAIRKEVPGRIALTTGTVFANQMLKDLPAISAVWEHLGWTRPIRWAVVSATVRV